MLRVCAHTSCARWGGGGGKGGLSLPVPQFLGVSFPSVGSSKIGDLVAPWGPEPDGR